MQNGPTSEEFEKLFKESRVYLGELSQFFEDEVTLLMGPARAVTKYITAFLYKVALQNTNKNCEHLDEMMETSKLDAAKLVAYLERTEEFLQKRARSSKDSATFIPVDYHSQVAASLQDKLTQCQALLQEARAFHPESKKPAKSWLSLHLHFAQALPNIWATGYGLGLKSVDKHAPLNRLQEIHEHLLAIRQKSDADIKITKTTAKAMQIDCFTGVPPQECDYHQHAPALLPLMDNFKSLMEQKNIHQHVTKEDVHHAIKTEYPTPALK
ncbi:hypothetical protein [Candidatus Berkiella aquae]|uniref:Uncharacterized protein n=1 Tax=Candidatus Berkiella aquae TaxID=295108 RepID=A0A0Q9YXG4_9GAMM|nr:hypothetical protein [Candidatus Berkiella aquae]MCS5712365.1 hypothetical protein [Candidatus Berkiella aquae]